MRNKIFIFFLLVSVILLLLSIREIINLVDRAKAIKENRVIAHLMPLENHNKNPSSFKGKVLVHSRRAHVIFYDKNPFLIKQYVNRVDIKFILSFYDHNGEIINSTTMSGIRVTQIWYHSEEYEAISGNFIMPENTQFLCLEIEGIDLSNFPPIQSVTFFARDDEGKLAINLSIILVSMFAYACTLFSIVLSYLLFSMRVRKKREIGQLAEKKK